ncbi:MAG: histidine kinase [Bacteroidota bacterium]
MSALTSTWDRSVTNRILRHLAFWVVIVVLLAYHGSLFGGNFTDNLINMITLLPSQMAAAYLMTYVQVPKLLNRRYFIWFVLSIILVAYALAILAKLSIIHIASPLMGIESLDEKVWEIAGDPVYLVRVFVVSIYIPAILMFLVKMTRERFRQENKVAVLEKEKRTNELNFLKAQINPHLLFNTLNNIYSLSKNEPESTSELILKLSDVLDYTIYECSKETVPVIKEWELIENYIELEALRYGGQLNVVLTEEIDDDNARVAPLILISLVENAFKYALKGAKSSPIVKVLLTVKDHLLTLEVSNTISGSGNSNSERNSGVGLQNVRRQLELFYEGKFSIQVDAEDDNYNVELTIQL